MHSKPSGHPLPSAERSRAGIDGGQDNRTRALTSGLPRVRVAPYEVRSHSGGCRARRLAARHWRSWEGCGSFTVAKVCPCGLRLTHIVLRTPGRLTEPACDLGWTRCQIRIGMDQLGAICGIRPPLCVTWPRDRNSSATPFTSPDREPRQFSCRTSILEKPRRQALNCSVS